MQVGEVKLKDLRLYITSMKKSMYDKLFFIDKLRDPMNELLYFDFGCADGELFKAMEYFGISQDRMFGYDINAESIAVAREKLPAATFSTDRSIFNKVIPEKSVLILSSVMHELYNYSTEQEIEDFWELISNKNFKYICIRDMSFGEEKLYGENEEITLSILRKKFPQMCKDFETIRGPLNIKKNFVEFLLKYKYTVNWDREVRENYFIVPAADITAKLASYQYVQEYFKLYTLAYTRDYVWRDLDYHLKSITHMQAIYIRRSTGQESETEKPILSVSSIETYRH